MEKEDEERKPDSCMRRFEAQGCWTLKMKEGAMRQEKQADYRSWKSQSTDVSLEPQKELSPDDTLLVVHGSYFQILTSRTVK